MRAWTLAALIVITSVLTARVTGTVVQRVTAPEDAPFVSYGSTARYPEIARRARVQGKVILDLSVDATGEVTDVRIVKGIPLLDDIVVDNVKTWRAQTTSAFRKTFVYEFVLDASACAPVEHSAFVWVTADHLRVVACLTLIEINVTTAR